MKSLVVYFSHPNENYNVGEIPTGNTKLLGDALAKAISADVFEIVPEVPYPKSYQACVDVAIMEKNDDLKPAYIGDVENWDDYDTIYLGYPIWWGDLPMIVYNFIDRHDFSKKTVVPFNTHEGSGNSGTYEALKAKLPTATLKGDGWNVTGKKAREESTQKEFIDFIKSLQ